MVGEEIPVCQQERLAVIDIGSNSGRVVVLQVTAQGHLEAVAAARSPLGLIRDADGSGRLPPAAVDRTVDALRDFLAVASGAGAGRVVAVATAAVREATNATSVIQRLARATGIEVRAIDGAEEARYAFIGAVHGLPVENGLMVDVGGGSMEVSRFRGRELLSTWTLPLGALRLTSRYLSTDPPRPSDVARLGEHVVATLRGAAVPSLRAEECLVGTGGTIRNLAKMQRATRPSVVPRLHGYPLTVKDVRRLAATTVSRSLTGRAALPGLSTDRADSIAGGALAVQLFMEAVGAGEMMVSAQGLREGIALDELGEALRTTGAVRRGSISALVQRFRSWDADRARRRGQLAQRLVDLLAADSGPELREMLDHAATVMDCGRSIDYYSRWDNAALIVRSADLRGFTHGAVAMLSLLIERAGHDRAGARANMVLLSAEDRRMLAPAALVLALADELECRMPPGVQPEVRRRDRKRLVTLVAPVLHPWSSPDLGKRFRRVFSADLVVESSRG